ncbi:MAG: DHA2 family efflux MFS transporter permease subunit [Syntrophorhabdaceae bacterium]|nr:DHA2 family efflux MFS transporter permease subunit [Syntrophorhabdaceae bacterium]
MLAMDGAKKRYYLLVISVAISSFMAGLNNYIVNVSLPSISNYFNVSTAVASRIVLAYLITLTSSLLFFGRLGDRMGQKRILILGYSIFTACSLFCGLSTSMGILVFFRLIQGLGGAMLSSSSFAIIAKHIPYNMTGRSYGIMSSSVALGITLGAPLGGFISGYFSWPWIFFINVPVGVMAIILASIIVPNDSPFTVPTDMDGKGKGFDPLGAFLSFIGLATLIYGINTGRTAGWLSPSIVGAFALSSIMLSLFVLHEFKYVKPLLDFNLFKNIRFTLAILRTFMAFMIIAGNTFLLPFYLEVVKKMSPPRVSIVLLVYASIHVIFSPYIGKLSDRIAPRKLCLIGMASASLSALFFSFTLGLKGIIPPYIFVVWLSLSYIFFFAPNNKQIMHTAEQGKQGEAAGLMNTTAFLSMAFGVAFFEIAFSSSLPYVPSVDLSLSKAGIPEHILIKGFSNAYLLGSLLCFFAFLCSLPWKKD